MSEEELSGNLDLLEQYSVRLHEKPDDLSPEDYAKKCNHYVDMINGVKSEIFKAFEVRRITQQEADSIERMIEDKHRIFNAVAILNSVNCRQYGVSVDEYMAANKAIGVIAEKVMNEVEKLIFNDQKPQQGLIWSDTDNSSEATCPLYSEGFTWRLTLTRRGWSVDKSSDEILPNIGSRPKPFDTRDKAKRWCEDREDEIAYILEKH